MLVRCVPVGAQNPPVRSKFGRERPVLERELAEEIGRFPINTLN